MPGLRHGPRRRQGPRSVSARICRRAAPLRTDRAGRRARHLDRRRDEAAGRGLQDGQARRRRLNRHSARLGRCSARLIQIVTRQATANAGQAAGVSEIKSRADDQEMIIRLAEGRDLSSTFACWRGTATETRYLTGFSSQLKGAFLSRMPPNRRCRHKDRSSIRRGRFRAPRGSRARPSTRRRPDQCNGCRRCV